MMPKAVKKCPICGKAVDLNWKTYPFCSDRCRTTDLGNWSSEEYVTHAPLTEADEELDTAHRSNRDEE